MQLERKIIIVVVVVFFLTTVSLVWSGCIRTRETNNTAQEVSIDSVIRSKNQSFDKGMSLWDQYDYVSAEKHLREALDEEKRSGDNLSVAVIEQRLGALLLERDKYDDAYEHLISAYVVFKSKLGANSHKALLAKCQIALCEFCVGNNENAISDYFDAYEMAEDSETKFAILQMTLQIYSDEGNYEEAKQLYESIITDESELSAQPGPYQMMFYNDYGVMLCKMGKYELSIIPFKLAEKIYLAYSKNELPSPEIENVYYNLSETYVEIGDYENALYYCNQAIDMTTVIYGSISANKARALLLKAHIFANTGKESEAAESALKAAEVASAALGNNNTFSALAYTYLGQLFSTNNTEQSIVYYCAADEIYRNLLLIDSPSFASLCNCLCDYYVSVGQYATSIDYGSRAVTIFLDSGLKTDAAESYAMLAVSYEQLGDVENAKNYITLCEELIEDVDETLYLAVVYEYLGRVYYDLEYYKESITYYYGALCIRKYYSDISMMAKDCVSLGFGFSKLLLYEDAIFYYSKSAELYEQLGEWYLTDLQNSYLYLGFTYYSNDEYDASIPFYLCALKTMKNRMKDDFYDADMFSDRDYYSLCQYLNNIAAVYESKAAYDRAATIELMVYRLILDRNVVNEGLYETVMNRLKRIYDVIDSDESFENWIHTGDNVFDDIDKYLEQFE